MNVAVSILTEIYNSFYLEIGLFSFLIEWSVFCGNILFCAMCFKVFDCVTSTLFSYPVIPALGTPCSTIHGNVQGSCIYFSFYASPWFFPNWLSRLECGPKLGLIYMGEFSRDLGITHLCGKTCCSIHVHSWELYHWAVIVHCAFVLHKLRKH